MFCFSCILFEMLKMELQGEGLIYTFPKLNCGGPTWNALFRCIKHTSKFHIGYHDLSIQNMYSNSPPKKQTRQLRLGVTRRWEGPSKNNQSILWWVHEKNFSLRIPFRFSNKYGVRSKGGGTGWQDHAWPNAVETMFQRFGRPESYPTLLEVVRMLPEDSSDTTDVRESTFWCPLRVDNSGVFIADGSC